MFIDWLKAILESNMSSLGLLILIAIIFVGSVLLGLIDRRKVWYGFVAFIIGFYLYVKLSCGPNLFDVRIMYPMAEKISQYIEKHGIPKSLKDIPDLPYGLEGCERSEEYLKGDNNGGMEKTSKGKAILYNVREKCHFKNIELSYWLQKDSDVSISITLSSKNRTYVDYGGGAEKDKKIIFDIKTLGSSKTSGICNPMRQ